MAKAKVAVIIAKEDRTFVLPSKRVQRADRLHEESRNAGRRTDWSTALTWYEGQLVRLPDDSLSRIYHLSQESVGRGRPRTYAHFRNGTVLPVRALAKVPQS